MESVNVCGTFCSENVEKRVRDALASFSGRVENIYFHRVAQFDREAEDEEEVTLHRVFLSFVVPCSRNKPNQEEVETEQVPVEMDKGNETGAISKEGLGSSNTHSNVSLSTSIGTGNEVVGSAQECFEMAVPEMKGNPVDSFWDMELEETQQQNYLAPFGGGLLTLTEEQLHAEIDNQLRKNTNTVDDYGTNDYLLFKNIDFDSPDFDQVPEEVEMKHVPDEIIKREERMESCFQQNSECTRTAACSVTTIRSTCNPKVIQNSFIPQINIPVTSLNQLGYTMAATTAQNRIICPNTLPPTSSQIVNSSGPVYNWAYSQATSAQSTIINLQDNKFFVTQPGKYYIPSQASLFYQKNSQEFQTRTGFPGSSYSASLTHPSPCITKIETIKYDPDSQIQHSSSMQGHNDRIISQFGNLPKIELAGVPKGHTYESWILEQGLYNARKLGLHKIVDKDHFPFKCPLCEKKYKNPNGIKYHAKYAHGPKCVFTCSICQRDYATRHGLSAHRRSHKVEVEPVLV